MLCTLLFKTLGFIEIIIGVGTFIAGGFSAYAAFYFVNKAKYDKKADKVIVDMMKIEIDKKIDEDIANTQFIGLHEKIAENRVLIDYQYKSIHDKIEEIQSSSDRNDTFVKKNILIIQDDIKHILEKI